MQTDLNAPGEPAPEPATVPGNPAAVARILASRSAGRSTQGARPAPSPSPAPAPAPAKPGQSMHPDAVRARRRRELEKAKHRASAGQPPQQPAGSKFTPAALREVSALPPGEPVMIVPSPDELKRATRTVAMLVKVGGLVAAAIFKDDEMKVPETDATETAELIVDGWPELANGASGDAKKVLAMAAVGSLVIERAGRFRRRATLPAGPTAESQPAAAQPMGAMTPLS